MGQRNTELQTKQPKAELGKAEETVVVTVGPALTVLATVCAVAAAALHIQPRQMASCSCNLSDRSTQNVAPLL